ncbi:MAG: hypothetical protein LQ350_004067 [Teloschistes chrysophthalmus]|nr:MAG: hypothetical protein LQ350_004067 [Niorma chrysophthalma]
MKSQFFQSIALLAASLSSVTAAPATYTTNVNATYDDLPNAAVTVPLNTYRGLLYGNWTYATVQAVQVGGVASASPFSRAVSNPIGTLTLVPQKPTWNALAPLDFFFGFAVRSAEAIATLAVPGTVTFTGFSATTGKQVASMSFDFTPPLSPVEPVPMKRASLPKEFNQPLGKIVVTQTNQLGTVLLMDNLHYLLYSA